MGWINHPSMPKETELWSRHRVFLSPLVLLASEHEESALPGRGKVARDTRYCYSEYIFWSRTREYPPLS